MNDTISVPKTNKKLIQGGSNMKNKKILATVLTAALASTMLTGCGGGKDSGSGNGGASSGSSKSGDTVTLKVFSNLPDRKTGQG